MVKVITDFVRNVTTGVGINSASVELQKHSDNSVVTSGTTAGTGADAGKFSFDDTAVGYPGATSLVETSTGATRKHSSKSVGFIGPLRVIDLLQFFRIFRDGVVPGIDNELAVSADGVGMDVDVASGFALARGLTHHWPVSRSVTITAAHATLNRIDIIVLRVFPRGTTTENDEGKWELVAIAGTPASTPVAPTPTQSGVQWEEVLAEVAVDAAVTSIAPGKVTDKRRYTFALPSGGTANQVLRLVSGKLAWNTLVAANITDFDEAVEDKIGTKVIAGAGITVTYDDPGAGTTTITNTAGGAGTITVQEGDVTVDGSATTLDFDASDFNVTSSPAGEANVSLAYGNAAGTPAEGSHKHTRPISVRANLGRDEVADGLANVTSTTGQHASTPLFADLTLTNGVIYDFVVGGTASIQAPTQGFIYMTAVIDSLEVLGSKIIGVFNGEGTETATKPHGGFCVGGVTGNGGAVRCGLWFKVSTGTGKVGSAAGWVMAIPRDSGAVV